MIAKFNLKGWNAAHVLLASQQHQLGFVNVDFETVEAKPIIQRRENTLQSSNKTLKVRFWTANQKLSIVRILDHHCILRKKAKIISEDAEEQGAQCRSLKDADVVGKLGRDFGSTLSVGDADTLGVILEVGRKPGWVNSVCAELG